MSEQFKFDIGDLLIGNADTNRSFNLATPDKTPINLMLIIHRENSFPKAASNENVYIVFRKGKSVILREDMILKYIESGKVRVIKRNT